MKRGITLFFISFLVTLFVILIIGVRPLDSLIKNSTSQKATTEDSNPNQELFNFSTQGVFSVKIDSIDHTLDEFGLELPINGATGFTSVKTPLYEDVSKKNLLMNLDPGTAFTILQENQNIWYVKLGNTYGFLEHKYCMINLPDVIPSIIYYNSNSVSSLFKSVGKNIDGITDKQLYNATAFNDRFGETQYIMPVLYSMARHIAHAQQDALRDGNCLMIYETYRPKDTQEAVSNALSVLMSKDSEVMNMVECKPWEKNWFISTGISNHQKGAAMDVTLVKLISARYEKCGKYSYIKVSDYSQYEMPTEMHELSKLACTFTTAVPSDSKTAWKNATLSSTMTDAAILLQHYCTNNELYPLASEWWHFNDLNSLEAIGKNYGKGTFTLTQLVSSIPSE